MRIGGFQKTSLIDYPGKISSIIFTIGCNFRCPFCYVPQLILPERIREIKEIKEQVVFSYLEKNKKFIDAIVITGGEPTIYEDLLQFVKKIKKMGFLIAIETNGTNFPMLKKLVKGGLVDYVEMDVKTRLSFEDYNKVVGGVLTKPMFENVKKSVKFLLESKIQYEFRTTLVKNFHRKEDVIEICRSLAGARAYYLQNFRKTGDYIENIKFEPFDENEIEKILNETKRFINIKYRE